MGNSFKAIFIIIGTVIGAGFASGQEIYSFFNVYQENGIMGLVLSSVITGFVIYYVLRISNKYNVPNYKELLETTKASKFTRNILNIIINLFLLMSFYIMVAGFVAYFKQEFNIPKIITSIIITIICYITFHRKLDGITRVNNIIIPILIIIVLMIGAKAKVNEGIATVQLENFGFSFGWLLKSIEYASYNSILLIPILISIREYAVGKEKYISIFSSIILFTLSMIIFIIMYTNPEITNMEIPLVYVASKYGKIYKCAYGIVIVFAIFSTMISAGYGFLENTTTKNTYSKMIKFLCFSAIIMSQASFSNLVNLTYPVFGILGILQFIKFFHFDLLKKIAKTGINNKKQRRKNI